MSHYEEQRENEAEIRARFNRPKHNQSVRLGQELLERRKMGHKKYGTHLEDAKLSEVELLQHAKEEALDLAEYLQTLIDKKG